MEDRTRPPAAPATPAVLRRLRAPGRAQTALAAAARGVRLACLLVPAWAASPAVAGPADGFAGLPAATAAQLSDWMLARAREAAPRDGARIEVDLGRPDPRLRLGGCARTQPYLPAASRPWGRTRVGLRCVDGPVRWNITLPVTVRVLAPSPVLREPLPAGAELAESHLTAGETDWAASREAPLADTAELVGRRLARALPAGAALRPDDLRQRRWFSAGERVRVVAAGRGWRVSTEGQALSAGLDGQPVRVRTEGGRVVSGLAVGERRVEIPL